MSDSRLWRYRDHLYALSFTRRSRDKMAKACSTHQLGYIIYKFSEMNDCTEEELRAFDALPAAKKVVFTHKDYGLKNQVIYIEFKKTGYIPNDTDNFRKYIDLYDLISGKFNESRL